MWRKFHNTADYIPVYYGHEPPWDKLEDKDVYIVDFSYKRDETRQIGIIANSLTIYDHHKTHEEELRPFMTGQDRGVLGIIIAFDKDRSGAGIAWDREFPTMPRPWLINYVEDRDIWRNAMTSTKEVNAYISSLAFDFNVWENVSGSVRLMDAAAFGMMLVAKTTQYCAEVSKNTRFVEFHGSANVPLVNAPQVDVTELHQYQMEKYKIDFSIAWWQRADGLYQYSLRSIGAMDVSALAKLHGGGGHHNAAGFELKEFIFS
jgi:oligoribonuclease NrnB/cAMP/cGMP phosphodiesterase (DHH superfamily)